MWVYRDDKGFGKLHAPCKGPLHSFRGSEVIRCLGFCRGVTKGSPSKGLGFRV